MFSFGRRRLSSVVLLVVSNEKHGGIYRSVSLCSLLRSRYHAESDRPFTGVVTRVVVDLCRLKLDHEVGDSTQTIRNL